MPTPRPTVPDPALSPLLLGVLGLLLGLALSGCGGFRLQPVNPSYLRPDSVLAGGHIALVQTQVSVEIPEDRVRMLTKFHVPEEMQRVMTGLGAGPTPYTLQITITRFRNGRYGPARMHTQSVVFDPSGQVVRSFENEAVSVRGSRETRLERIAQTNLQGIADAL